jgi:hypothetical protein
LSVKLDVARSFEEVLHDLALACSSLRQIEIYSFDINEVMVFDWKEDPGVWEARENARLVEVFDEFSEQ